MKYICTVLVVIFVSFYTVSAFSMPYCSADSECGGYGWNSSKNAFACGKGRCECDDGTRYDCFEPCADDSTCDTHIGSWTSTGSGNTERIQTKFCEPNYTSGVCDSYWGYLYRCVRGYYGNPTSSNQNACVRCPAINGIYGTTVAADTTSISGCYIPSGTELSDTTGKYEFSQNCYY